MSQTVQHVYYSKKMFVRSQTGIYNGLSTIRKGKKMDYDEWLNVSYILK